MKLSKKNNILITGCAGFIGFHVTKKLLEKNYICVGIDNINNYYDQNLKKERLKVLKTYDNFIFKKVDLSKTIDFNKLKNNSFSIVINLAAQAGVRYAFEKPHKYVNSNIIGFLNLMNYMKIIKLKN